MLFGFFTLHCLLHSFWSLAFLFFRTGNGNTSTRHCACAIVTSNVPRTSEARNGEASLEKRKRKLSLSLQCGRRLQKRQV